MNGVISYSNYIKELRANMDILSALLDPSEPTAFPYLAMRLRAYKNSLGSRLKAILEYCIEYKPGRQQKRHVSFDSEYERGYEVPFAYSYMVKLYGGNKETWWRNVNFLCVLGLLYRHKPDTDAKRNTPAQEWSVRNADWKTLHAADQDIAMEFKPDSWYSFPRYTESVLKEADRRAEALKNIGTCAANKDLIRDVLGERIANTAYGNGFPMGDKTAKQRELLAEALRRAIAEKGYCYPDELIAEAAEQGKYWRGQVEKTYSHYRDILIPEMGCVYRPVRKEDRNMPGITGKRWIITPAAEESRAD